MLNMTKVDLEFVSGPDMYLFFEKDGRGGISYIFKWHGKSSNKYFKSYDSKKNQNILLYT